MTRIITQDQAAMNRRQTIEDSPGVTTKIKRKRTMATNTAPNKRCRRRLDVDDGNDDSSVVVTTTRRRSARPLCMFSGCNVRVSPCTNVAWGHLVDDHVHSSAHRDLGPSSPWICAPLTYCPGQRGESGRILLTMGNRDARSGIVIIMVRGHGIYAASLGANPVVRMFMLLGNTIRHGGPLAHKYVLDVDPLPAYPVVKCIGNEHTVALAMKWGFSVVPGTTERIADHESASLFDSMCCPEFRGLDNITLPMGGMGGGRNRAICGQPAVHPDPSRVNSRRRRCTMIKWQKEPDAFSGSGLDVHFLLQDSTGETTFAIPRRIANAIPHVHGLLEGDRSIGSCAFRTIDCGQLGMIIGFMETCDGDVSNDLYANEYIRTLAPRSMARLAMAARFLGLDTFTRCINMEIRSRLTDKSPFERLKILGLCQERLPESTFSRPPVPLPSSSSSQ